MQSAPDDERPTRTVPQAAEQHRCHQREVGTRLAMAIAAQRNVEVIAQPRRQGDVPAPPEIREADRRIGETEVVWHRETQAHRRADRGGGITSEVAEDLPAESERTEPRIQRARDLVAVVDRLGRLREETVGEHDLLEQAQGHQHQAETQLVAACATRLGELRHQLGRTHDRPRNQMREERHEQRVVEKVGRRLGAAQIDVEGVGHRRERVERDADRQHDVPRRRHVMQAEARHQCAEVVEQEMAVLEVSEHAEVGHHRQQHPRTPRRLFLGMH